MVLLAGALIAWPDGLARTRLRYVCGDAAARRRVLPAVLGRVPTKVIVPVAAGLVGLVAAGPLHACAAALLGAVVSELRRRAGVRGARLTRLGSWERALDDASSALRAGAGPEEALHRAAEGASSGDPGVAEILSSAASHARLGGDVATALHEAATWQADVASASSAGVGGADRVAGELAGAWHLATRHGVVLAEVVDGLRADVASRRERAVRVDAALAGPRATAVILTGLPGFGVLLGSGFGADPLGVLVGGPIGGALCLIGAGFLAAGLMWTERIVDGASR
ncbi:secretion protein F [Dietzia sp. UCD-THP]|uniref:type II secretion system F family protein n=1 Tax=Dietzia sp. UCD-THP TaxID=1292020 RepID=UPI00036872E7|nr:type II secretion system F family protein [Dietzia sp. UCD-THP]EYT65258.1 secretion protein F [Dietzia sp. UCD-THP]